MITFMATLNDESDMMQAPREWLFMITQFPVGAIGFWPYIVASIIMGLQVYDAKDPDLHHIRNIMRSYYHEITPSRWGIITLSESALFGGILPWLGEFRILELWTFFVYAYPSQKKIASI